MVVTQSVPAVVLPKPQTELWVIRPKISINLKGLPFNQVSENSLSSVRARRASFVL